jgi:hypothetical protein
MIDGNENAIEYKTFNINQPMEIGFMDKIEVIEI